jgi:hypothetical protein
MDVKVGCTINRVKEVLLSILLLMEGKDAKECCEHSKNCVPCHLPIEGIVYPQLALVPEGLPCFVSGEKKMSGYYALVCSMSMWSTYGIIEATFHFSTI